MKKYNIINNNSKSILNIKDHILRTWPEDCFLISIILNKPKSYDWIMNSFVQICTYKFTEEDTSFRMNFYPSGKHHYSVNLYDYCPFIDKYVINNNIIMQLFQEYTDFVVFSINNGYYISCALDQCFTKKNKHFGDFHPNYIYGYDCIDNKIYLADNFDEGKFSFLKIPFYDINKSFDFINKQSEYLHNKKSYLYRLKDCDYKFDLLKLVNLLEDYLNSCDNTDYKSKYYNNRVYGIECYKLFYPYLRRILTNLDLDIDLRSFVFLIDHKKMMHLRVKYMIENNYLCINYRSIIEDYSILKEQCEKILFLAIKYNYTKNIQLIDRIIENLKAVEVQDYYLTDKLLKNIKKRC